MINIQNLFYLFFLLFICEKVLANDYNSLIVEADNSIEYFEKEKYYLASGNAIATKNGVTLKADKIKAFFENKQPLNRKSFFKYLNLEILYRSIILGETDYLSQILSDVGRQENYI